MSASEPILESSEVLSQSEVERLLAQVAEQETNVTILRADGSKKQQSRDSIQPYDFRNPVFLSASELRKLRLRHEEFIQALASRLSIYLRMEFGLQMSQLQTLSFQKFSESLPNPTTLTLFQAAPLRGVCILEINPRLGMTLVDRLLGGPGHSVATGREMSDMEITLLDQVVNLILGEWCGHWSKVQELRPVTLGRENNGRFLHTSPPDTVMLVLAMEAHMGDCVETIQLAFPYSTIEPLVRALSHQLEETDGGAEAMASAPASRWTPHFENINVPVSAEWAGLQMSARRVAQLRVGEVVPLSGDFQNSLHLRLARMPKFTGRLGTAEGKWAVELTGLLKTS